MCSTPVQLEDTIYHLKQEIASFTEERHHIIFENIRLRSENEQLRSQLLAIMPIKEEGTVCVARLHCQLLTSFV